MELTKDYLNTLDEQQRQALFTALARTEMINQRAQKTRSVAQGATFGFADEVEAAFKATFGEKNYRDNVEQIRAKLAQYRQDAPIESVVTELGGALGLAAVTRGRSAPLSLTQIASRSLGEGALSGYGTSEGDIIQQATQTATGAGVGGLLGTGAHYGLKAGSALLDRILDSIRRVTGGRGASAVENEILRLAEQTGETVDEIVARVARGEIMADNKSIQFALRDLMSRGGITEAEIRRVIPERAESLRLEGQAALKEGLAPGTESNVLRAVRAKESDFKKAESDAYNKIFSQNQEVPELQDTMLDAVLRTPGGLDALKKRYTTRGNLVPPFKENADGSVEWARIPTLEDAEILRRTLQQKTDEFFKTPGQGDLGADMKLIENDLRTGIDAASPDLKATRAQWRRMVTLRDAFEEGRKAFNIPAEQLEIDFARIAEDAELSAAFREGVMARINDKMTRVGSKQLMGKLADTNTLEGRLFDTVFPGELKTSALNKLLTAGKAQATYQQVIEGPSTALTQAARKESNTGVGLDEALGAARLNPADMARVGVKVIKSLAPQLTDKQRGQIADVLMQADPDLVRQALTDSSAMARLQNQVQLLARRLQATGGSAGAIMGGTAGAATSGQYFTGEQQ